MEIPPPPGAHPVPSSAAPSTFRPGAWCPPYPPQSMASSSNPYWIPGLQHPGMVGSMPQGPWCAPASFANMEDSDLQVLGVDSTPPGGLLNFLNKNTPRHGPSQVVINGSSSQPISVGDDTGSDCPRTEKRMLWTKDEEGARKNVERVFGVLQSRFTIIRRPARLWKRKSVGRIMLACVILHNMIVEDEKEEATIHIDLNESPGASFALPPEVNVGGICASLMCFIEKLPSILVRSIPN